MAITNLTGYTWVGNDNLTIHEYDSWIYNINFTSNNTNYSNFNILFPNIVYTSSYNPVYIGDDMDPLISTTGTWTNNTYKTIAITGGTHVTNSTLIAWLEANGTLTPPAVTAGKTQIGNRAITKKMFGTREITKEVVNGVTIYEKQSPSGYTLNVVNGHGIGEPVSEGDAYLKVNTTPNSINDYDFRLTRSNQFTGTSPVQDVTKVYIWSSGTCAYDIDNGSVTYVGKTYDNPEVVTLTGDTTIKLYYIFED